MKMKLEVEAVKCANFEKCKQYYPFRRNKKYHSKACGMSAWHAQNRPPKAKQQKAK